MAKPTTPVFRVSYPAVFEMKLNKLSKKMEYSVVCLFPKGADLSKLKQLAFEAGSEKWGPDQKKWPKKFRSPFRKHEERATENEDGTTSFPPGYEEGGIFMTLKSQQKPQVVDQSLNPILDKTDFYAGCYAIASINAYAYEHDSGNCGVNFGLGNLQKVKDGDPLGGGQTKAQDDFVPIAGAETASTESADSLF